MDKILHPHQAVSKELMQVIQKWFTSKNNKKHLLFANLVLGLFESEKIDELEEMNYESLESRLIEESNEM